MSNFDFVGFDGFSYSISIADEILNYKNIVIFYVPHNKNMSILFFNENITLSIRGYSCYYILDNGSIKNHYDYIDRIGRYNALGYIPSGMELLYCSDNLIKYKDDLASKNCFIDATKSDQVLVDVFSTIGNDYSFNNVFSEVFSLLPVVITFLISFYGIFKGIGFIKNFLRKS